MQQSWGERQEGQLPVKEKWKITQHDHCPWPLSIWQHPHIGVIVCVCALSVRMQVSSQRVFPKSVCLNTTDTFVWYIVLHAGGAIILKSQIQCAALQAILHCSRGKWISTHNVHSPWKRVWIFYLKSSFPSEVHESSSVLEAAVLSRVVCFSPWAKGAWLSEVFCIQWK